MAIPDRSPHYHLVSSGTVMDYIKVYLSSVQVFRCFYTPHPHFGLRMFVASGTFILESSPPLSQKNQCLPKIEGISSFHRKMRLKRDVHWDKEHPKEWDWKFLKFPKRKFTLIRWAYYLVEYSRCCLENEWCSKEQVLYKEPKGKTFFMLPPDSLHRVPKSEWVKAPLRWRSFISQSPVL